MSPVPDFRKALHKLRPNNAVCSVYSTDSKTDLNGGETNEVEETVYENIPCHLSYSSSPAADGGVVANIDGDAVLFLDPEYQIPAGSKIVVLQNGVVETYIQTGKPRVYKSSQQISLKLQDKKA